MSKVRRYAGKWTCGRGYLVRNGVAQDVCTHSTRRTARGCRRQVCEDKGTYGADYNSNQGEWCDMCGHYSNGAKLCTRCERAERTGL